MIEKGNLLLLVKISKRLWNCCAYDAVVGSALAAEVERLVVFAAFVDHAVGEHGLVGDTKDEDTE